ncbi:MAG: penicillin-binding protein 1B [Kangiellaceae bacterium]|nr:penicillin-binding protein 1B [Kangiellaceae bacterium]
MASISLWQRTKTFVVKVSLILFVFIFFLVIYLDSKVRDEFKQQAWSIPAKVYARPLNFSLGQRLLLSNLTDELEMLGYRQKIKATSSGEYEQYNNTLIIHTRPFKFWDVAQKEQLIQLTIENSRIVSLIDFSTRESINYLRLDPLSLGNIQVDPNSNNQDRQLVKLSSLPDSFISALLISEDRSFHEHWGISLKGIARALWSNISAGEITQGGSTLTQQLMKNHFLSNERSLWRKSQEALMALLTEIHYSKEIILQSYVNEVYLGQSRNAAIHGFARASEFYFDRQISELNLPQVALLVGMVKGPSYYNPRNNPERAKERRDLVLQQMLEHQLISQSDYQDSVSRTLMVVSKPPSRTSRVPAFMGVVRRELANDFSSSALSADGLKLFTTLDPLAQRSAEESLTKRLNSLEKNVKKKDLQGAIVLTDISSGEILSVVGDRNPNYVGFNRAVDAYRQTGSVIKPFVYLAALQRPDDFSLVSKVNDQSFSLTGSDGSIWTPKNYDRQEHGDQDFNIELAEGLINSYNIATARLAMKVGIKEVTNTILSSGFSRKLPAYPSIALGSKEMSPLEVIELYQVIANQGIAVKPQALIAVQDQYGNLINRYPRKSEQVIDEEAAFLLRYLLTEVTKRGTAKSLSWQFPKVNLAGKTGTTNDLRDSWYAGFDDNKLAVVWIGRDDNKPTGLTGASGALKVWTDLFKQLSATTIELAKPSGVVFGYQQSGFLSQFSSCRNKSLVPFYQSHIPDEYEICD